MIKPRVVHILGSLSPYALFAKEKAPVVRFETERGTWAGIFFANHWSDLLCRAILDVTHAYDLEVWQPDLRADSIYEHVFDSGLKHILFPARCKGVVDDRVAIAPKGIECPLMLQAIEQLGHGTLLHLNALMNELTEKVLRHQARLPGHVPILLQEYGGGGYAAMARRGKRIWRRPVYLVKAAEQRRLCRHITYAVVHTKASWEDLRQAYSGPIGVSTMGVDFDYWQPGDKHIARRTLNLPEDRLVLLTASMLRPHKQVDRLVRVLVELDVAGYDFIHLVVGGGEPEYETKLRQLAAPLLAKGKARFLGRIPDDRLLCAYQAADLFLSIAHIEGGPVSVMKAFACQVPVFTTDVGHVAEFMRERGVEVVVPNSPRVWRERLSRILSEEPVPVVSREEARQTYDWPVIGRRFAGIYQEVFARHGVLVNAVEWDAP